MKKTMKKSLLITSLLAASFCLGGGVAAMNAAANETVAPVEFATAFGAEIRASAPSGLRFKLQLSDERKAEIFADNSNQTLGMFIFLGSKIGELTATTTPAQKIDIQFEESDLYKSGDYWYAHGVMTNLYIQNYNKQFIGVGYVATAGETTTYDYSDFNVKDNVRSMSYVAIEGYKVAPQAFLAELIEKSVYAEYGVTETRTKVGDTITYSFTKGDDTWATYEEMKEDIPVSVSVSATDADLWIGESLDLEATLAIGETHVSNLDVPFTYSVNSDAVTVKDGVVTAVADGEAEITVSFGDFSQTVTVNVSEKANMVFNPAAATASEQIEYLQAAFDYGKAGGVTQTFVSAEENDDTTYGGAYMRSVPKKTGNGRMKLTPNFVSSAYEQYDVVNVWLYLKANNNTAVTVYFFDDIYLTQSVTPNQWAQISLSRSRFMENIDTPADINSDWFCGTEYGTVTEIWLGEIVATDAPANVVFDPATGNAAQITYGHVAFDYGNTNPTVKMVSANHTFETYNGAYFQVTPQKTGTGRIFVTPIHDVSTYATYDAISFWFYVYSTANENLRVYFFEDVSLTRTIATNQWVQVLFPVDTFIAKVGSQYLCAIPFSTTAKQVYIGKMEAINYDEMPANIVYDPATYDTSLITLKTSGQIFNNVTPTFVSAENNTNTTYGGAYVRIAATNLSTTRVWGDIYLTSLHDASSYSGYTAIKVWVYIEAYNNTGYNPAFCGGATNYATIVGQSGAAITHGTWTQLIIPIQTFIDNANSYFLGGYFGNKTWNMTAVCIGEIVAV